MSVHRIRHVATAVAVSLLVAACSGDDDDSSSSEPGTSTTEAAAPSGTDAGPPATATDVVSGEPELTFGFIGPGVGLLNELAIGQDRGLQLAVQDINAAGGVLGAPAAFVRVDETAPDPIDGVVDQLVEQGADVLVGAVGSSSPAAILPILGERSLLACSASATATSLTAGNTPTTFVRTALRDDYFAGIVADQVMFPADGSPGPVSVMIVGRDDVYGNELTGGLSAELTARGAAVDTITYPPRRVSFPDESAQVAAAAPDRVILASYTEAPNLIAQIGAAGYPVEQIVGLDGLLVPRLAEQTFPDDPTRANGLTVIGTTGDRALMARLAQVPAPQDQTSYGGQMYDCVISLALASISAGSTEPATIGQQLMAVTAGGRTCSTFAHCVELLAAGEDIDYDGTTGRIEFDGAGDISAARITTSVVIDGQLQAAASQDLDLVVRRQQEIFASAVFVTQLQQALKVLGYFEGDITGVYDEATTAAVAALQRDLGLPDTGQFDEATEAALRDRLGVRLDAFTGSVAQLQQALTDRGFYTGPIDGRYSAATIEAVRAFQRDLGVPETGVIDVATLQAIYARGIATGVASVPTTTAPPETTAPPATAPPPPDTTAAPPPPDPTTAPPDDTTPEPPSQNLYEALTSDGRFTELLEVIDEHGYATDLAQPGLFTIFAPTDEAIDAETFDQLMTSQDFAESVLNGLVTRGSFPADELADGEQLPAVNGTISVEVNGSTIRVNGVATVEPPEIMASNGIAHAIDAVPLPD